MPEDEFVPTEDAVVDEVVDEPVVEEQPFAISREEWEQTQNYLRATAPILQQVQELVASGQLTPQQGQQVLDQQQNQPPAPEYDPFEQESVTKFIQHQLSTQLEQALKEQFEPFQGLLGMVAAEKGEQLAKQTMDEIAGEIGEFDRDLTYVIASPIIESGTDPGQAFRQVAQYLHARDEQIRAEAREQYKADHEAGLLRLAGAPGELQGGATVTEMPTVPTGPNRYKEAVSRALAARQAARPVG